MDCRDCEGRLLGSWARPSPQTGALDLRSSELRVMVTLVRRFHCLSAGGRRRSWYGFYFHNIWVRKVVGRKLKADRISRDSAGLLKRIQKIRDSMINEKAKSQKDTGSVIAAAQPQGRQHSRQSDPWMIRARRSTTSRVEYCHPCSEPVELRFLLYSQLKGNLRLSVHPMGSLMT